MSCLLEKPLWFWLGICMFKPFEFRCIYNCFVIINLYTFGKEDKNVKLLNAYIDFRPTPLYEASNFFNFVTFFDNFDRRILKPTFWNIIFQNLRCINQIDY